VAFALAAQKGLVERGLTEQVIGVDDEQYLFYPSPMGKDARNDPLAKNCPLHNIFSCTEFSCKPSPRIHSIRIRVPQRQFLHNTTSDLKKNFNLKFFSNFFF